MCKPILFAALSAIAFSVRGAAPASAEHGQQLFVAHCLICHQFSGQGVAGIYPPLAKSDFFAGPREKVVRVLVEGLSGELTVNGRSYAGAMPPILLNDADVADVLTYVARSWGNDVAAFSEDEVNEFRSKTSYPTFARLQRANSFPPLPPAPEGFTLREVVRLPSNPVRMAGDGTGRAIYILCGPIGDVWRVTPANGQLKQVLWGRKYLERLPGDLGDPVILVAMTMDKERRLYVGVNQQNNAIRPVQNRVTIYRTTRFEGEDPIDPKPWFQTNYPGNSAYVHGLEHIAFGPDGYLYAGNGARTDAAQPGGDTNYFTGGETPVTSSMWRIDPRSSPPTMEVYARGIRNAYGFCWNDRGEMFATENGPDAHAPEELNQILPGHHYGFPYRFADWTNKAYAHTPDAPAGLEFTLPVANIGPDGGFEGQPVYSFDPHSSPGGIVFLGDDFPTGWRGTFLMPRFGNFIRQPKASVGFDVLQLRLRRAASGAYEAQVKTVLAPLGRPNDVHLSGRGRIYISEYSRGTNSNASYSPPGRIIEMAVKSVE